MKPVSVLGYIALAIITLGVYPLYYHVTRTEEGLRLLRELTFTKRGEPKP